MVFGVPYDGAAPGREGAAEGPAAIRETSVASFAYRVDPRTGRPEGALDLDRGARRVLAGVRFGDLGDLALDLGEARGGAAAGEPDDDDADDGPEAVAARVAQVVRAVAQAGALPVVLGGDHSISLGVTAGLEEGCAQGGLGVLHVDAHLDAAPSPEADLTHATWVTHARRLPHVRYLLQLGARGWHPVPRRLLDHLPEAGPPGRPAGDDGGSPRAAPPRPTAVDGGNDDDADEHLGQRFLAALGVDELVGARALESWSSRDAGERARGSLTAAPTPWRHPLPPVQGWHLTVDIDALDPSVAPGTGVPVPLGPSIFAVRQALATVLPGLPLAAVDLTEVHRHRGDQTAALAAALLVEVLAWARPSPVSR